ncbi:hypothetical protein BKP37_06790 [Anaerobacillus alkalilacustris]|uniref:GerMN domain-containing protein n=1 Tax=Anaerobacillus alkalilacustris TaxID=393763 RepID=A0A1S2LSD2_9BACI|nr:GerMN domain-containing protein [Anaerobacillus alkalilacustris]OIJ15120.1 hypothetical protein BKP37_06790 [Anaerobacillus alkalilacustris]
MKKWISIFVTFTLLLVVSACGQGDGTLNEEETNLGSDEEQYEEQEDVVEESEQLEEEAIEEKERTDAPTPEESTKDKTNETENLDALNLYFADAELMSIYRVKRDVEYPKDEEGIQKALQLWIAGPVEEGLQGLVPENVIVQSVNIDNDIVFVSFSEELLNVNVGSSGELFITEQIAMVVEQFGYKQVFILINGSEIDTLSGHIDFNEPFTARSPKDFELYNK